ncbi:hypothetical protein ACQY0O_004180 [Thecaphora frezii]
MSRRQPSARNDDGPRAYLAPHLQAHKDTATFVGARRPDLTALSDREPLPATSAFEHPAPFYLSQRTEKQREGCLEPSSLDLSPYILLGLTGIDLDGFAPHLSAETDRYFGRDAALNEGPSPLANSASHDRSMATIYEQQEAWYPSSNVARAPQAPAPGTKGPLPITPRLLAALSSVTGDSGQAARIDSPPRTLELDQPGSLVDAWQQPRGARPWSAPGWNVDARNFASYVEANVVSDFGAPASTGVASPTKAKAANGVAADDEARQRGRSASNPPVQRRQLLSTATNESIALRSFQHVSSGHSFQSLFSGLHLDDPNALIPAGNGGGASHTLNQAGLFRAPYGPSPKNKKVDLYKTELCRQWEEKRWCEYKERCQFAHGPSELRPIVRHPLYKTQLCKAFADFRHDVDAADSRSSDPTDKPLIARLGLASDPTPPHGLPGASSAEPRRPFHSLAPAAGPAANAKRSPHFQSSRDKTDP